MSFGANNEVGFAGEVALSFWVKFVDLKGEMPILSKPSDAGKYGGWELLKSRTDHFVFCAGGVSGQAGCAPDRYAVERATVAVPNTWYNLALVKSGNGVTLYLNGAPEASAVAGTSPEGAGMRRGADYGGGRFLSGLVDEVALYSRALSPAEVQSIFQIGKGGACMKQ